MDDLTPTCLRCGSSVTTVMDEREARCFNCGFIWEAGVPSSKTASSSIKAMGPLRVLVVDDDSDIRTMLALMLPRLAGCEIAGTADNGAAAIDCVEALRPDLVVMDVMMPDIDGLTATREIKLRWPGVDVVGFTSAGRPNVHQAIVDAGATTCFDKTDFLGLADFIRERV